MSDSVIIGAVFGRLLRQAHSGVDNTDSMPDVHIITSLNDLKKGKKNPYKEGLVENTGYRLGYTNLWWERCEGGEQSGALMIFM